MKKVPVKLKLFMKKHFILTIGIFWLLIALLADFVVTTMDLQYDDSGLGTILILGEAIYAFPFWLVSEVSMPLKINEIVHPYLIALFGFVLLDLLVSGIIQRKRKG